MKTRALKKLRRQLHLITNCDKAFGPYRVRDKGGLAKWPGLSSVSIVIAIDNFYNDGCPFAQTKYKPSWWDKLYRKWRVKRGYRCIFA